MKLILALLLATSAWAAQSAVFASGTTSSSFTWPNASPYASIGAHTTDLIFKINTLPASGSGTLYAPRVTGDTSNVLTIFVKTGGELCWNENINGSPDLCAPNVLVTGTYYYVRVTRGVSPALLAIEVWDALTGSNYQTYSAPSPGAQTSGTVGGGSGCIGNCAVFGKSVNWAFEVLWLKWRSTAAGVGQPRIGQATTADLADWRFEGNGTNNGTASGAPTLTLTSGSYITSPVILPLPVIQTSDYTDWSAWLPCRAGYTCTILGANSVSNEAGITAYQWAALDSPSGNAKPYLSTTTASTTVLSGYTFGTHRMQLTVTDAAGTAATTLDIGAVARDSNGVVIPSDSRVTEFFGPLMTLGQNPWLWADKVHMQLSEYFGDGLTNWAEYQDTWHGPTGRTATFTNGLTTVTSTGGAQFGTVMNCAAGDNIAANVPVSVGVRIQYQSTASCSGTTLTLNSAWTGTSGTYVWGYYPSTTEGQYAGGGNNVNYYDVTAADAMLYYSTGNVKYKNYALTRNTRWWTSPGLNRSFGLLPRLTQPLGLVACATLWASECLADTNMQDFWTDYAAATANDQVYIDANNWPSDYREEAARREAYSRAAKWHPNSGTRAAYVTNLNTGFPLKWTANLNGTYGLVFPPVTVSSSLVTVTNGSTQVDWVSGGNFAGNYCITSPRPDFVWFATSTSVYDSVSYNCTKVSDTRITLERPYAGTSGNKYISVGNLVGPGKQPFIEGWASAMYESENKATGNSTALTYMSNISGFTANYGYYSAVKGIYYGRIHPGCEPIGASIPAASMANCVGPDGDAASRFYALELLGHYSYDYLLNGQSSTVKSAADIYYGSNFGLLGGPSTSDGYYATDYVYPTGYTYSQKKAKDYGFGFGRGKARTWPAARLGGALPANIKQVKFSFVAETGTVSTAIEVRAPSGAESSVACSTGTGLKSCDVPVDFRIGNPVARTVHTLSSGTRSGDWQELRVQ